MNNTVKEIAERFDVKGNVVSCEIYGEGHINETYLVTTSDNGTEYDYILQKINNGIFKNVPELMSNIKLVTDFARENIIRNGGNPDRETMTIICTKDGKPYYFDGDKYYRCYIFIENTKAFQIAESTDIFYQSAVAFGHFAKIIADFDSSLLNETIARFHDTRKRYNDFLEAVKNDKMGRKSEVEAEIKFVTDRQDKYGLIVDKLASGEIPLRVTHNDTKLNNVLFDSDSLKAIAVVDLDTIMPGSVCYDFGDSIRFGCNTANEDEPNLDIVNFDINLFEAYTKGYLSELKDSLTQTELDNLPLASFMMTVECGMRFLTDYLNGDVYFKISREKHNLDRCRVQFKLAQQMQDNMDKMKEIVQKYSK